MVIYRLLGDLTGVQMFFAERDLALDHIASLYGENTTRTRKIREAENKDYPYEMISYEDEDGCTIDSTGSGDQLKIFYHDFVLEPINVIC